ncbi:Ppx/GppA phosphatase family protein [Acrocarpospora catenulata]|uniref:Ppx/GppA phosphatase family protein n=1 Tax=Acrocarpospora catenulata TaxID=2836182 RepID=UPI001BDB2429|nr:Ppx/GppA phosphatase family protein [Acrocarpospora catenulata]
MTKRVAAIDCGTNSVRLLLAEWSGDTLLDIERRMQIVRLGQGVDRTGRLAPEALERTFQAMRGYASLIGEGVPTRVVATSATRDAANRDDFVSGVVDIFGVPPEVITGAEEAALSFAGATRSAGDAEPPYLVVDIGGGSTEFVVGTTTVDAALSVDIGCVRLTERHTGPSGLSVPDVISDIESALDRVEETVPVRRARTLIGLAGSVTTVAGIALDLPAYDSEKIHHSRIPAPQVHEIAALLPTMTAEERAAIPVMHPGRVDVISAGALILDRIIRRYEFPDVLVSEHDILDGIAWSLL